MIILVNALLCLKSRALPIGQEVNQNGVESEKDQLANEHASLETLNSFAMIEGEGSSSWDRDSVVADQSQPDCVLLQIEASDHALPLSLNQVKEEGDEDYRQHLEQ